MSRGPKKRTVHLNTLLTVKEYEEFHSNTPGYGEKAKVVRKAISKFNEKCKKERKAND